MPEENDLGPAGPTLEDRALQDRLAIALPIRCEPIEGETCGGLALRLAAANGYRGITDLPDCPSPPPHPLLADGAAMAWVARLSGGQIESMARWLVMRLPKPGRFAPGAIAASHWWTMGALLEREDFAPYRRACPACIAEKPRDLMAWHLEPILGCLEHGNLLVERCICGKRIDYSGLLDRCARCNAEIGGLEARPMEPADRDVTAYMVGRFQGPPPAEVARLDPLPLYKATALIRWVGNVTREPGHENSSRAIYARGFAALLGPSEPLFARIRAAAGHMTHIGPDARTALGDVRIGHLQPALPGLATEIGEPIAALVREAAAG